MLQLYQNNDCIELIEKELKINPNFIEFSNSGKNNYFLKIDQSAEFIRYYYEESLAGFIACYCNNYESKNAFITLVLVDKVYRGKGISRKMFSLLFNFLQKKDFNSCGLEVKQDNINALNLYKSLGFKSVKLTDPHSITMSILL